MTELQQLVHSLEGTVRATGQLRELKQAQHQSEAPPSTEDLTRQLHKMEIAQLSQHAQTAKWFLKMIEILGVEE